MSTSILLAREIQETQHQKKIKAITFPEAEFTFESLFPSRKQFDSNSCDAWLVSGIYSYIKPSIDVCDRKRAFETCVDLLNLEKSDTNSFETANAPSAKHVDKLIDSPFEKLINAVEKPVNRQVDFSSAEFLINETCKQSFAVGILQEFVTKGH